jgi:hypothetical protein
MVKIYKAQNWEYALIEEYEIISETEKFVTVLARKNERREAKISDRHAYCKTLEEAKDWVENYYRRKLEAAKRNVDTARNELSEVLKKIGR